MGMKVYTWEATSNDGCYNQHGKYWQTQEDAYAEMMETAVNKMKWNVEYDDVMDGSFAEDDHGVMVGKESIGYAASFFTHKIVHESYSGIYTYQIKCIEFGAEETEQIKAWDTWVHGEECGIEDITQAYTRCNSIDAWEDVVDEWELSVPNHDDLMQKYNDDETGCICVEWHLRLKPIADKINARIVELESAERDAELVGMRFLVQYDLDCGQRVYSIELSTMNDCNNFFEDEDKITKVWTLVGEGGETFYREIPVAEAKEIALKVEKVINAKEAK